ncbi:hypothetical protein TIFTF001_028371 [Ficus carica]|uniref:Uncharacterized protein n=1 Tax=Ficus carica TaxID=3494 RepID=A0AA88DPR8_FICCA|nr:hypothetical protein TIFTF001_028371 [Ficus carica]
MRDMQAEFGVSFNYLRAWREKEAALTSLRGDDAESYNANLVYPDAAFGICVQHLAANLKTKYKDFKGPLKTYFDSASRSYLLSLSYKVVANIFQRAEVYNHDNQHCEVIVSVDRKARLMPVGFLVEWLRELQQRWFVERREEALKLTSKLVSKAEKLIRTNFSIGLIVTPQPVDQFEYAVTNNASQIWIVDMSERTFHPIGSADGWDVPEEVSGRKLSILPKQSVGPKGHGFEGFCPKEKNMSLFGVVDVMVMDTTNKHVPIQYP